MLSRPKLALLTLLTAAVLLASCQSSTNAPRETAQPTASGRTPKPVIVLPTGTATLPPTATPDHPVVAASALRGKTVTFWHPWQGELDARVKAAVQAFNRSNEWGIQAQARSFYSDGALEDALDGASADPAALPDVIAGTSAQLAMLGDHGAVANLSPYLKHPDWGFSEEESAAYLPAFWDQDVQRTPSGGLRLGIPLLRTARVLFYNKTWAEELGFPNPPTTTADFKAQSCAAAVKNNQSGRLDLFGTGGWMVDSEPMTGLSWFNAFGADSAQAGQPFTFDSEEAEAAVTYLQDLGANGCIWVRRSGTPQEELARRRALFYTGTLQDLHLQKAVMDLQQNADEWTVIAFPAEEGAGHVLAYGYSLALAQRHAADPDQQMAAWLFLRWLSDPAQAAQFTESWPSFPVSEDVEAQMAISRASFPWDLIIPLEERALPAPGGPHWPLTSRVLEDVTWSIFHLPAEQTADLLPQADATLKEMLDRAPTTH